jgi:hypothetical protein
LAGEAPKTLQETGDRMGLSRERVRQIECQAKERMRRVFQQRRRVQAGPKPPRAPVAARRRASAVAQSH